MMLLVDEEDRVEQRAFGFAFPSKGTRDASPRKPKANRDGKSILYCHHRRGATPSSVSSGTSRPGAGAAASRAPAGGARRAPVASTSTAGARRPLNNSGGASVGSTARVRPAAAQQQQQQQSVPDETLQALTSQMSEMRVSVEALEKERDFYFGKLREIEIIVAARLEEPEEGVIEEDVLKKVQEILYQTEVSPSIHQKSFRTLGNLSLSLPLVLGSGC